MARCVRFPLAFALLLLAVGCAPRGAAPPVNVGYDTLREPLTNVAAPLSGRRILLDPGHGGRFRGVVGRDGFSEAEANLGVALYLRGLLVEYGTDLLGPIPNVVVFQFNPEKLERALTPPPDSTAAQSSSEASTNPCASSAPNRGGGGSPGETITLTAHFDASDDLGANNARSIVPRAFGVGPQLVALERMIKPTAGALANLIAQGLDAIGDAISGGSDGTEDTPPQQMPRILFIWGPARVIPVEIQSMTITEKKFDPFLNPVQAEVKIVLKLIGAYPGNSLDRVGRGALVYTEVVKDLEQIANLTEAVVDVVPF